MSFGARVWGPTGLLELDETSFTVRVIYSAVVESPNGRFVDIAVPGCDPSNCNAVAIPVTPYPADSSAQNLYAIQFEPEVLVGAVRVWCVNRNIAPTSSPAPALAAQRVLVMRYK